MTSVSDDSRQENRPVTEAGPSLKRQRNSSPGPPPAVSRNGNGDSSRSSITHVADPSGTGGNPWLGANATFRSLSTCNRCRLRKHRCDQRLPICSGCEKAGARCTGYDPVLKREVPRSYVYFLENRVAYLESLLEDHHISFDPPDPGHQSDQPGSGRKASRKSQSGVETQPPKVATKESSQDDNGSSRTQADESQPPEKREAPQGEGTIDDLVGSVGLVPVHGTSSSRYLGSTSGMSFARVVFAAIKSSVNPQAASDSSKRRQFFASKPSDDATTMRDSFFGLQNKSGIKQAPFPDHATGLNLVNIFFEHANPMYPTLHREEFMAMFENAYGSEPRRGPRELYLLNIVFAIGKAIFLTSSKDEKASFSNGSQDERRRKDTTTPGEAQAEEYHASAAVHLESVFNTSPTGRLDGSVGGLEELQAVLLLATFAILRPVPPGLWYIIGVAVRLAVDLGLHHEDGDDADGELPSGQDSASQKLTGRREYIRDMRRRLWWCVYSLDRLVSGCVGRPVGISDQVITTEFPSLLDDKFITKAGLSPNGIGLPSYKHAAHHYFGLRLLQSEVIEVLQHQHAWQARARRINNNNNPYLTAHLSHPFLENFTSFRSWRADIDQRLQEWMERTPTQAQTGVAFSLEFFELNYWLTIVMLYRQSLSIPAEFEGEFNTADEVGSPTMYRAELQEDEDMVFLRVAEAGRKVLRLYRQLHHKHLFNYTYLDTHHLFMSGIAYLYAIWHSPTVRRRLTMEDVDFTVLAATSVLGDLIEKCPPAEACRDAFKRMSNATIQMCLSSTGFGDDAGDEADFSSSSAYSPAAGANPGLSGNTFQRGGNAWSQVSYDQNVPTTAAAIPHRGSEAIEDASPLTTFSKPMFDANVPMASNMPPPPLPAHPSSIGSVQQQQQQQPWQDTLSVPNELQFEGLDTGDLDQVLGMDWEGGGHDFSNGGHLDLFDGFFFGNSGGGV